VLSLLLICVGIFLRLGLYVYDHSLWLDEAWLARDVLERSVKDTLLNVFPDPSLPALAPVGFLLIEKLFVAMLGNTELALRLFPFLCGAASVFTYWLLLKSGPTGRPRLWPSVFSLSLVPWSTTALNASNTPLRS